MNYGYGPQEMDTAQDLVVRAGRRADPPIHDAYGPMVARLCTSYHDCYGNGKLKFPLNGTDVYFEKHDWIFWSLLLANHE